MLRTIRGLSTTVRLGRLPPPKQFKDMKWKKKLNDFGLIKEKPTFFRSQHMAPRTFPGSQIHTNKMLISFQPSAILVGMTGLSAGRADRFYFSYLIVTANPPCLLEVLMHKVT